VISAARQIPTCESVDAVVIGGEHNTVSGVAAEVATLEGVQRVITLHHERYLHPLAERYAHVLEQLIRDTQSRDAYRWIVAPSSSFGKNLLPRLAAPFDVQPLSDVIAMPAPNQYLRPIYAGNALALVESIDPLHILTIRTTAFPRARPRSDNSTATIESYTPTLTSTTSIDALSTWIGEEVQKSERPELTTARIVVSGGRGLKSGENFKLIYELADVLGAAGEYQTPPSLSLLHMFLFDSQMLILFIFVLFHFLNRLFVDCVVGATRAAVDAGFVPNDMQVGQTGKIVAPELYIAVGISGAIQHLAGMKDSKVIVAINKDPDAPIFQVADYGLVADLFTAVPELIKEIQKAKGR
jgi:electron transfer flavoprotein alpha subunit